MLFINYEQFLEVRKGRRNSRVSPGVKKTFSVKAVLSCLLAVACFVTLSIPMFVSAGITINSTQTTLTLDDIANLIGVWAISITSMNSTCSVA